MCGIIGIVGQGDVAPRILRGLRRLEYRGYDSAGIATIDGGKLERRRAEGKLDRLAETLADDTPTGATGIGHTRWATHGAPIEANAHPHITERVGVVHNGIIENHRALKESLTDGGAVFTSDTDTEVIAHLFTQHLEAGADICEAARQTFAALEGAYAVALILADHADTIIVARDGSPLAIGHGDGEMYLGSDGFALAPFTSRITYLADGDWAVLTRGGVEIYDRGGDKMSRPLHEMDAAAVLVDKGDYRHFMAKEIHEQPEILSRSFAQYVDAERESVRLPAHGIDFARIERVVLVACGTAYFAAQVAQGWIERLAGLPAEVDIASEFRYRAAPLSPACLAVFISQSGETADTLAAQAHCKAQGVPDIGIVNVPESALTREVAATFPTYAGVEIGVASTKAFTAQLAALAALAIGLARARGALDKAAEARHCAQLMAIPRQANRVLQGEAHIAAIARGFTEHRSALFMGRGVMRPLALEGALKLKEISYIHAEGFAAGELKHGPIALVDENMPVVVAAPDDSLFEKTISNMREVMARQAQVVLMASRKGIEAAGDGCAHCIEMPPVENFAAPILYALPMQLLAYHAAVAKGTDVDQPRNLAKSVTVE